jgi:thymidylate kinase
MLIVVEGIDGAGKSFFINQISNRVDDSAQVLHRGPLRKHPLEEYALALKQHDPRTSITLCDRWHLGELIYGPLYRGQSRLTAPMTLYVEHVLDSLGAVKILMQPEFPVVERRLATRGEKFLQHQHRRLVFDAYAEHVDRLRGWRVIPGTASVQAVESIVTTATSQAQKASEHAVSSPSYVGVLSPRVLFLASEISMRPLRPKYRTTLPPYVGSFAEFFYNAMLATGIYEFGVADPSSTAIHATWEKLGRPVIIPIGNRAMRKAEDEGVPFNHVISARPDKAPYTAYAQYIKEALS